MKPMIGGSIFFFCILGFIALGMVASGEFGIEWMEISAHLLLWIGLTVVWALCIATVKQNAEYPGCD